MYGTSNHEASFEKAEKLKIVSSIIITIKMISTNAKAGEWKLKNKMLHQKFKNSWSANKKYALRLFNSVALLFQIIPNEIPISK